MVSVSNDFSTTNFNVQRAYAREFARASKNDVANMAVLQYSIENQNREKRFNRRINATLNTLPVLAVASGLATGKSTAAALAGGATWGLALLAPDLVVGLNRKMTSVSPRLKKAEEKHPVMTFLAGAAASIGTFMGSVSLLNRAISNPKVRGTLLSAGEMAKDTGKAIQNSGFVKSIGAKLSNFATKVKSSSLVQSIAGRVKNSEFLMNTAKSAKSLGQKVLAHAPEIAMLGVVTALIGKSMSTLSKINNNKKQIEESQLQVANSVIDSYEAENEELRTKLSA